MTRKPMQVWKPGWWRRSPLSFPRRCRELQDEFRRQCAVNISLIPWTHKIFIEANDSQQPDLFCGEAAFFEKPRLGRNAMRLACFWTGCPEPEHLFYCQLPTSFILVPNVDFLGRVIREALQKCSMSIVNWNDGQPGRKEVQWKFEVENRKWFLKFRDTEPLRRLKNLLVNVVFDDGSHNGYQYIIITQEENRDEVWC